VHVLVVASLVEEAADHVHPVVAAVALHPALLHLIIVLFLLQVLLDYKPNLE
jgi:hypothetical protein